MKPGIFVFTSLWLLVQVSACVGQERNGEPSPDVIPLIDSSVSRSKDEEFYPKRLTVPLQHGSILIKAPASVRPGALRTARVKILGILQKADAEILDRLAGSHLEIAIIPLEMKLTDLLEFRHYAGKKNAFDQRYDILRGATTYEIRSGVRSRPLIAIGEDDILRLMPLGTAQSALHHEFGHALYLFGLSPEQRSEWESLYQEARTRHLFENKYAMVNVDEFFPELTQAYFDTEPYFCSASQLARVHPKAYKFLARVYSGANTRPAELPPR
ncbi:MAG: hypothetical protein JWN86_1015 [Planctomycetota bacterium]|nr:hypothetical protein [Planctomycetota bacterium]